MITIDIGVMEDGTVKIAYEDGTKEKQYPHNPAHKVGTCADCGGEMIYNVPRLGHKGGYVHKTTGQVLCEGVKNAEAHASATTEGRR